MRGMSPATPGWQGSLAAPRIADADALRRVTEIVLGVSGALMLVIGLSIQLTGHDRWVGLHYWTARVGVLSHASGSLLLGLFFAMVAFRRSDAEATTTRATRVYGLLAVLAFAAAMVLSVLAMY